MHSIRHFLELQADRVEATLAAHRCPARITGGTVGPRLIRFHLDPAPHTRFAALHSLADDIALALRTPSVTIHRGQEGVILEFAHPDPQPVTLLALLQTIKPLPSGTALLGVQANGVPLLAQFASPEVAHILVAGTTGCGKSVLLRTLAASLILTQRPAAVSLVAIDPKGRTFPPGFACPHLLRPVVTAPAEADELLRSLALLMKVRDERRESQPLIVVLIDELADLVMSDAGVESTLLRLTQRGREAGIHLVAATQRPSAAILSGLVRANFPLRLVGRVVSPEDARIAAGQGGVPAHQLVGRGDFLAVTSRNVVRFQAAQVTLAELQAAVGSEKGAPAAFTLPPAPVELPDVPPADDLAELTEQLRPWWAEHGGEWGSKTQALRYLFGDAAPTGGSYWRLTEAVIARLENSTTTTALLPSSGTFHSRTERP